MNRDFWLSKWEAGDIGFHQPQGHPALPRFWPQIMPETGGRVLVPLCGKTPDMRWLAERGHAVTGIEFSERAAADFFAEQGYTPRIDTLGPFKRFYRDPIEILVGDFFAADTARLGVFDAVYDRASLIALPAERRGDYAAHLLSLLAANAHGLLITVAYDQAQMNGPPFSVPEDEVRRLFAARTPACLEQRHIEEEDGPFARNGVDCVVGSYWQMGPAE